MIPKGALCDFGHHPGKAIQMQANDGVAPNAVVRVKCQEFRALSIGFQ